MSKIDPKLGRLNNKDKVEVLGRKLQQLEVDFMDMRKLANLYKALAQENSAHAEFQEQRAEKYKEMLTTVFPDWQNPDAWDLLDEEDTPQPVPEKVPTPEPEMPDLTPAEEVDPSESVQPS